MSDTPDSQNPAQPEDSDSSRIEPTSEVPDGLAPSPGLQPPTGIEPPQVSAPQFLPPQSPAPQFLPPQSPAPQSQAPQYQPPQFGPPQQPYQQPQQQYVPQPGQPGAFDPSQPTPPRKGLSTGAIIGIVAGGIVLLLIVAGVVAIGALTAPRGTGGSANEESPSSAQTAPAAVDEYLTAIADGDAELAGSFVDRTSSDTLLTDEVLAKSAELAPITNIVVDEDVIEEDETESVVSATFDVGDKTVTRDFRVWNFSDEWQIFDGLMNVSLSPFGGLDSTVNGVVPGDDYARVFPGTYQIELGVEQFTLSGDTNTFTLVTEEDSEAMYDVQPVLTEEATEKFRALVRTSLTECVAQTSLATPCGLDVTGPLSDGAMPVDGTIQRTLTAEGDAALNSLKPTPSYDQPTVVSSSDYIQINTTLEADVDGQRVSGELLFGGQLKQPHVDFAQKSPAVTWE